MRIFIRNRLAVHPACRSIRGAAAGPGAGSTAQPDGHHGPLPLAVISNTTQSSDALIAKPILETGEDVAKPRTRSLVPRRLPPLVNMSGLLKLYRLGPKKQMAQNFLLNPRICDKMVRMCGKFNITADVKRSNQCVFM